jgi:uncharacterized protein
MAAAPFSAYLIPVLLLVVSNIFMTIAWYGHLNFKQKSLMLVVFVSWLIALPEYIFQVPANRMGHAVYSAAQLKGIQEIITLLVFCVFSVWFLKEPLKWNHGVAFVLIVLAAFFMFYEK